MRWWSFYRFRRPMPRMESRKKNDSWISILTSMDKGRYNRIKIKNRLTTIITSLRELTETNRSLKLTK
jgi:hypothetical protein